jgi:hypothetical protein
MDRRTRIRDLLGPAPASSGVAPSAVNVQVTFNIKKIEAAAVPGVKKNGALDVHPRQEEKKSKSLLSSKEMEIDFSHAAKKTASAFSNLERGKIKNGLGGLFKVMQLASSKTTRRAMA